MLIVLVGASFPPQADVVTSARVTPPVLTSAAAGRVETPHLTGPAGTVVTLLNWSGRPFNSSTGLLDLNVTLGFTPSRVESVEHGTIKASLLPGLPAATVTLSLPLISADFLLFYK